MFLHYFEGLVFELVVSFGWAEIPSRISIFLFGVSAVGRHSQQKLFQLVELGQSLVLLLPSGK